jgi:hypothetical protein
VRHRNFCPSNPLNTRTFWGNCNRAQAVAPLFSVGRAVRATWLHCIRHFVSHPCGAAGLCDSRTTCSPSGANSDAMTSIKHRGAPQKVERCLFSGASKTRGPTHALGGQPWMVALGLGATGKCSPMDVYVERDLPGRQITGFPGDDGLKARKVFVAANGLFGALHLTPRSRSGPPWRAFFAAARRSHSDPENKCAPRNPGGPLLWVRQHRAAASECCLSSWTLHPILRLAESRPYHLPNRLKGYFGRARALRHCGALLRSLLA